MKQGFTGDKTGATTNWEAFSIKKINTLTIAVSALLCAIGIIIPWFSPIKVVMEPASFTLGSHIATMIAMFISPVVGISVSLITAVGFLLGGFPLVVVIRAMSHVVFAALGALYLQKRPDTLNAPAKSALFCTAVAIVHAACEVIVVSVFYFGMNLKEAYYAQGYLTSVLLLVGLGTVVHSFVDYYLSLGVWNTLKLSRTLRLSTVRGR